MIAVQTQGLRYRYPSKKNDRAGDALKGIDLTVNKGEIFGFLGPNGSGKTTLFKILSTLMPPTGGNASILGRDVVEYAHEIRRDIGVVFQNPSLDKKLTVEENLFHQGHLYGLMGAALREKVTGQLEKFGLADRRKELVETLSGGLKRRVEVAKGLLHEPRILILDEPSTGLDLGARRSMWDSLESLRNTDGVTVLVTTHLAGEADRCGKLAIMHEGKVVATGSPDELKNIIGGDVISITTHAAEELMQKVREKFGGNPMVVNGEVRLERSKGHEFVPEIVEAFPGMVTAVKLGKPTLEDVFVHFTGRSFWLKNGGTN